MLEFIFVYCGFICIGWLFILFFWRQEDEVFRSEIKYIRNGWYESISEFLEFMGDEDAQYEYYWLKKEGKLR